MTSLGDGVWVLGTFGEWLGTIKILGDAP